MKSLTHTKNIIIAMALTAPLALVGCSSDKEATEPTTTSTKTSTSTTTSTSETSAPETTAETTTAEAPAGSNNAAAPQLQNPVTALEIPTSTVTPLAAPEANPQDAQAINQLVRGLNEQQNMKGWINYTIDNSCPRVVQEIGGEAVRQQVNAMPDIPLREAGVDVKIQDATEIRTEGNRATARVSTDANGHAATDYMYFERAANGQWQFCNAG